MKRMAAEVSVYEWHLLCSICFCNEKWYKDDDSTRSEPDDKVESYALFSSHTIESH